VTQVNFDVFFLSQNTCIGDFFGSQMSNLFNLPANNFFGYLEEQLSFKTFSIPNFLTEVFSVKMCPDYYSSDLNSVILKYPSNMTIGIRKSIEFHSKH